MLPLEVYRGNGTVLASKYIELYRSTTTIPKDYYLVEAAEKVVQRWHKDWQSVWNEDVANLSISSDSNPEKLQNELAALFRNRSIVPDYSKDLTDFAREAFVQGNPRKAMQFANAAHQLYPESANGSGMLGILHVLTGEINKGKQLLNTSLEKDRRGPANENNLNTLAYAIKGMGKIDAGLQLLLAAVAIHPGVANLYDSVGEFYLEKKDIDNSIQYYEKALGINPDFQNAQRMLEQIRKQQAKEASGESL